jgi:glycosyltransferase involved in cell wall biosynthesis
VSETLRLAVLCDYGAEKWASMDRVTNTLVDRLALHHAETFRVTRVEPPFHRRFSAFAHEHKRLFNADRMINRLWEYPRAIRPHRSEFDLFHVADHSYAFLARGLPAGRIGVFCHDLDIFKPLLAPGHPGWARLLARYALGGMERASIVFYSTEAVRAEIERHALIPNERLVHAPYGVESVFAVDAPAPSPEPAYWPRLMANRFLLHVGSCIPRKRVDVLLDVFAAVRAQNPGLLLVQVGGTWTAAHEEQIARLGIGDHIVQLRGIDNPTLAALYARARAVLLTSEAEGFGLPVVEALSCGAVVVASDLPVTREVGSEGVVYCPVADVGAWATVMQRLLREPGAAPARAIRLAQAARYSWNRHAGIVAGAYLKMLGRRAGDDAHAVTRSSGVTAEP